MMIVSFMFIIGFVATQYLAFNIWQSNDKQMAVVYGVSFGLIFLIGAVATGL